MKTIIKRFALLTALIALFAALAVTAYADEPDPFDMSLVFAPETQLTVYVDGAWSSALSGSYGFGDTAKITAPDVSGKTFSHWEAGGSIISYANPLELTMNAHTTLYAVYASGTPTTAPVAGFTSVTRTNDGAKISFQAIASGDTAGIIYSTTATGDNLTIGGTDVTQEAAVKSADLTTALPNSILDENKCWMLQITPTSASTVYHARAYVTVGGTTTYGDEKAVKLSDLESGVSMLANLEGFEPGINDLLDQIAAQNNNGDNPSGGNPSSGNPSSGNPTYAPTISETKNGTVTVNPKSASSGTKVTITAKPDEGYQVDAVTVTGPNGKAVEVTKNADGTYSFTQPAGKVTIDVTFVEENILDGFTDVDASAWYADAVKWALKNGVMSGYGNGLFGPNDTASRAMMAQILWNMEGKPVVNYAMGYTDVDTGAWYAEAVRWATAQGIMAGYGRDKFGPSDAMTREQLVTIMYRYAQLKKVDVSIGEDTNILSYDDALQVSQWAVPAMQWAVGAKIVNGTSASTLSPKTNASRAEIATIIMRYRTEIAE